jgi:D-glycero-D-manno-heptose 1,7-bisphosphate phosphatase
MTKLIILDRDGIINYDSLQYIKSVGEFRLIPGSVRAIARLNRAGFDVAVATNQSGIARGYYDHAILTSIHAQLMASVQDVGGCIDIIEYCPHMPESGCMCRKPKPGMLYTIAKQFNTSLDNVPFIGDRITDIQAAKAAGAIPMIVLSSMTDRKYLPLYPDVPVFSSLSQCVDNILADDNG